MRKLSFSLLAVAVSAAFLSGCAGIEQAQHESDSINAAARSAEKSLPQGVVVSSHPGAWILGDRIAVTRQQPQIFQKPVVFKAESAGTLGDIAQWITDNTGVPVRVDVMGAAARGGSARGSAMPMFPGTPAAAGTPPLGDSAGSYHRAMIPAPPVFMAASSGGAGGNELGQINYSGTLKGLLDIVANRAGVWWRYRDGVVIFFNQESRIFTLPLLSGKSMMMGMVSTMGGGGAGGSSMGGAGSSMGGSAMGGGAVSMSGASGGGSSGAAGGETEMSTRSNLDYWKGIRETVQAIAGSARVVVDPTLGAITVTGTPPQIKAVAEWVDEISSVLSRQVSIDVHVYNVKLTREDNYGIDLNLAQAASSIKSSIVGTGLPTILSASSPMTLGANILTGPYSGSASAIQALSTLGSVSQVVSDSGITPNGQMMALQSARTVSYLQSETALSTQIAAGTTLQPGAVTVGFTGSFLPKIVNGKVMLNFNMTTSDLLDITTFTSNGSSVQLPDVQSATFEQTVSLKPNQTLVLTGFRQRAAQVTNNGVGSPYNPIPGGGVDAQTSDVVMAVVITAHVL